MLLVLCFENIISFHIKCIVATYSLPFQREYTSQGLQTGHKLDGGTLSDQAGWGGGVSL